VKEAPPVAHPDLDQLLNALLRFAQDQVVKHGSFLPFGATMTTEGEIRLAAAHLGDDLLGRTKFGDLFAVAGNSRIFGS
jgi:hypothetical protein